MKVKLRLTLVGIELLNKVEYFSRCALAYGKSWRRENRSVVLGNRVGVLKNVSPYRIMGMTAKTGLIISGVIVSSWL